jgi:hypothetical protein
VNDVRLKVPRALTTTRFPFAAFGSFRAHGAIGLTALPASVSLHVTVVGSQWFRCRAARRPSP